MNRNNFIHIAVALLSLTVVYCRKEEAPGGRSDDEMQARPASPRQAAMESYESLYSAQAAGAFRSFQSIDLGDSATISLGDSIQVNYVGLNRLKNFSSRKNKTQDFVQPGNEIIYPLESGAEVMSGIVVKMKDRGWQFSGVVSQDFSNAVDSLRLKIQQSTQGKPVYLLQIPALYLSFMATDSGEDIHLVSLVTSQSMNVNEGDQYKASILFDDISAKLKSNSIILLSPDSFKPQPKQ